MRVRISTVAVYYLQTNLVRFIHKNETAYNVANGFDSQFLYRGSAAAEFYPVRQSADRYAEDGTHLSRCNCAVRIGPAFAGYGSAAAQHRRKVQQGCVQVLRRIPVR